MAESRQRKKEQRERVQQMLEESRSADLPLGAVDFTTVPGLLDALNGLTAGLDTVFVVESRDEFDLKRYETHIQDHIQDFPKNPIGIIKQEPPFGFPFLIFLTHKFLTSFSQDGSIYSWIYSAQSMSLLCRVLSLIPLYFIGKLLVGSRRSFWGLLILIMLPHPAEFGSDVIREWPHISLIVHSSCYRLNHPTFVQALHIPQRSFFYKIYWKHNCHLAFKKRRARRSDARTFGLTIYLIFARLICVH